MVVIVKNNLMFACVLCVVHEFGLVMTICLCFRESLERPGHKETREGKVIGYV